MESITFRNYVLRTFGVKIDVWWENTFVQNAWAWIGAFHCSIHLLVYVSFFPLW